MFNDAFSLEHQNIQYEWISVYFQNIHNSMYWIVSEISRKRQKQKDPFKVASFIAKHILKLNIWNKKCEMGNSCETFTRNVFRKSLLWYLQVFISLSTLFKQPEKHSLMASAPYQKQFDECEWFCQQQNNNNILQEERTTLTNSRFFFYSWCRWKFSAFLHFQILCFFF